MRTSYDNSYFLAGSLATVPALGQGIRNYTGFLPTSYYSV